MRLDYKWQAALTVALGLFMAVLDNTVVNVALTPIQKAFNTDTATILWVVTAYFLAQAAVIPVTGYLSDLIGSKTIFITALVLFTGGSALCALAPNEGLLIAFRVLQGVGAGALFPTAFAIIFRVFPPAERGPASAVVGIPILLAPAFGPTIGGYLTTTFDWRAIFLVNVPVGIVALLLSARVLEGRAAERAKEGVISPDRKRFDWLGLILSMAGTTSLVYGITQAANKGWGDRTVLAFIGIGAALLIVFVVNELRVADPVMDVRLFTNYTFAVSNVLMWAVSAFLFGSLLLIPIFFERVRGLSPLNTGEILISQGLAAAVATAFSGRFYNRVGPRILATVGWALITVGTIGFTRLTPTTNGSDLQIWLILRGLGLGMTNIPLQTLALSVVNNRQMARASSLVNVTRQIMGAVGISAITAYFAQQTTANATTLVAGLQQRPPTGDAVSCVAPAVLAHGQVAVQQCVANYAVTLGMNDAFVLVTIGCAAATVLALFVGRDPAVEAARAHAARGESPQSDQAGQAEARPAFIGE